MASTAKISRTAHDLSHGNRLRLPMFGVTEIRLVTAGGKSSKSHLPPGSKAAKDPSGATDDFHFAPEKEQVKITYTLDNPLSAIQKGRLELFHRWKKEVVWTQDLKPEQLTHGKHEIPWFGKVTKSETFPDEFVTVEHSPYKLRITIAGERRGHPYTAWTHFHVLVKELELLLGDKRAIPRGDTSTPAKKAVADAKISLDRKTWDAFKFKLPEPGKTMKTMLLSNLFQTKYAQLMDNTAFKRYQTEWGDGPNIPVFAKAWIADSADKKVDAPKALGKVKFLWDWEDVAERPVSASTHHAKAKVFLDNALDYDKGVTEPKGDNCHKDRGGKRGGTTPHFPVQVGYAAQATIKDSVFPFKVETPAQRKWAAYSYAWGSGALAGKTGVLFQPSRMAGDAYKLTVYLAYETTSDGKIVLDVKDAAPLKAAVSKSTGTFEIWRELHLAKIAKKSATLPSFPIAKFQNYYSKAYIDFKDDSGAGIAFTEADWNANVTSAVTKLSAEGQDAVDSSVNQFTAGNYGVHFRAHGDFITTRYATLGLTTAAARASWLAGAGSGVAVEATYHNKCQGWAQTIIEHAADSLISPKEGVTIVQFDGLHNHVTTTPGSGLNGYAENFASAVGTDTTVATHRCGFVQCADAGAYVATATNKNTLEQTVSHEIGHHLFMSHSTDSVSATDPYYDANTHDNDWHSCLMSYGWTVERKYCGFCLLKLRGWDQSVLNVTAANNKK